MGRYVKKVGQRNPYLMMLDSSIGLSKGATGADPQNSPIISS